MISKFLVKRIPKWDFKGLGHLNISGFASFLLLLLSFYLSVVFGVAEISTNKQKQLR